MGGWDMLRARLVGIDDKPMIYFFATCADTLRTLPVLQHDPVRAEALRVSRRIEVMWVDYLTAAMAAGRIPGREPRLLAHSIIGLLQSVWAWYRPSGKYTLGELDAFYSANVRAMILST